MKVEFYVFMPKAKRKVKKTPAIVALILVASLSVAGCTVGPSSTSSPTPTSTTTSAPIQAPADYSSALTAQYESYGLTMERPFTKSTNARGNDFYKGVGRNATVPGSPSVTIVIETTKSRAEAKKVYNATVAAKLKEGYKANRTLAATYKATKAYEEVWVGNQSVNWFMCNYGQNLILHSWAFSQESYSYS
jgi:type IV pilus biogenesis protein CpaD/CtpE